MVTKKRIVYLVLLLSFFTVGSYLWKIRHTGTFFWHPQEDETTAEDLDLTVYVGDYLITREEVEWEYKLYMSELLTSDSGEGGANAEKAGRPAAPAGSTQDAKPVIELYNKILGDLIERKLLYQYLSADEKFSLKDPSRYTDCVQEWSESAQRLANLVKTETDRQHLKNMLCEKSILTQYIKDRVNPNASVSDAEVQEYYGKHKNEFSEPMRVVIRQIVVGTEDEAKHVRALVNTSNFASIAKDKSISPDAANGGLLGPFAKGDMPPVFDVAFDMQPRTIQGILKSNYGFHILMLEKKIPKVESTFEMAKPKIIKLLTEKHQQEEYKKWVESALNNIPIKSSRAL